MIPKQQVLLIGLMFGACLMAGCDSGSSEPDFDSFAERFVKELNNASRKSGNYQVEMLLDPELAVANFLKPGMTWELFTHSDFTIDVTKTESVTTPYIGTISLKHNIEVKAGPVILDPDRVRRQPLPMTMHLFDHEIHINFNYQDGAWKLRGPIESSDKTEPMFLNFPLETNTEYLTHLPPEERLKKRLENNKIARKKGEFQLSLVTVTGILESAVRATDKKLSNGSE